MRISSCVLVDERQHRGHLSTEPRGDGAPFSVAPRFYSQMKRAHKERVMPVLNEDDIEESFVRGVYPAVVHRVVSDMPHRQWTWRAINKQDQKQCSVVA